MVPGQPARAELGPSMRGNEPNLARVRPYADHPACAGRRDSRVPLSAASGTLPVRGEDPSLHPSRRAPPGHPACAGKLPARPALPGIPGTTPPARGEDTEGPASRSAGSGPSPRARGRLPVERTPDAGARTIPACAGKTRCARGRYGPSTDHPRVRGEDYGARGTDWGEFGPSPRTRGRLVVGPAVHRAVGTIPACAGKTPSFTRSAAAWADHPRVRGEDPNLLGAEAVSRRTIPACAGKTSEPWPGRTRLRDHPRVRGEDVLGAGLVGGVVGPSPRARGRPTARSTAGQVLTDHPRVRGEDSR